MAPPRPRGCARQLPPSLVPLPGSPAPAGMRLTSASRWLLRRWLPRARGDAPSSGPQLSSNRSAPPRPRGCALQIRRHDSVLQAPPRPRGCARLADGEVVESRWLPRARGDAPWPRPTGARLRRSILEAPPRPRGCAAHGEEPRPLPLGSPAPAGMRRRPIGSLPGSQRLPRARGDAPPSEGRQACDGTAPPRPRGCARESGRTRTATNGSPAPAGMRPLRRASGAPRSGLPRARGDAPRTTSDTADRLLAPPRPRGCAADEATIHAIVGGSPAPAGMRPTRRSPGRGCRRLPRARGDAPTAVVQSQPSTGAPPRPRGCAGLRAAVSRGAPGSPAPAGMRPSEA